MTATVAEMVILRREKWALRRGATMGDIEASRDTGFDPHDIVQLRRLTLESPYYLLVFRCPNPISRWLYWVRRAKSLKASEEGLKSGPSGAVMDARRRLYASDYDLMCVYRIDPEGRARPDKVMASNTDPANARSHLNRETTELFQRINRRLTLRLQHGAQDDWESPRNRGVLLAEDRYAAVMLGEFFALGNGYQTEAFYRYIGLDWPYNAAGRHRASLAQAAP